MNTNCRLTAVTAALASAAAIAPAAGAQDSPAPGLALKGAYLYADHLAASDQDFVRVVFRTTSPLPRRGDGALQAGVSIDGVNHSIGSVERGRPCYTGASEIKGGSIAVRRGNRVTRKRARIGRRFTVTVTTRDGRSVTRRLRLRGERRGHDSGRPLGC